MLPDKSSQSYREIACDMLLILAVCAIFFINLGGYDLWAPDEPRYAQVAREMAQRGSPYIMPYLNGEYYTEKPALFFWLIMLSGKLWGGIDAFSARFVSAVAGTILALLTYFFGRRYFNRAAGLLGALSLATMFEYSWQSRVARFDHPLGVLTFAALFLMYEWYHSRKDWQLYLGYALIGLSLFLKGPVGLAHVLLPMAVFLIVEERNWRSVFQLKLTRGLLLILLVGGPWFVLAYLTSHGAFGSSEHVLHQTLGRFIGGYSHNQPFYYYLWNVPPALLPWGLFLPWTVYFVLKQKPWRENQNIRFLIVWFVTALVFFSICKGKRTLYLIPLFPNIALLIVWSLREGKALFEETGRRFYRWWTLPTALLALIFLILVPFFLVYGMPRLMAEYGDQITIPARAMYGLYGFSGAIMLISALLLGSVYFRSSNSAMRLFIIFGVTVCLFMATTVNPVLNQVKSARALIGPIILTRGANNFIMFDIFRAEFIFYAETTATVTTENPLELLAALKPNTMNYVLMRESQYEGLRNFIPQIAEFDVVESVIVGHRDLVLLAHYGALPPRTKR